jgi:flagellin
MTELAEKAANGVLKDEDRDALQDEMDQLCGEIDRIATTANFNGNKLLDGSLGSSGKVKVECNPGKGFKVTGPDKDAGMLGGGQIYNDKYGDEDELVDGKTYYLTADSAEDTDLTQNTVTVTLKDANDQATGDTIDITVKAQKGDSVTIAEDGTGTSGNGLIFANAEGQALGETFTFDGEKWLNSEGKSFEDLENTSVTMKLDAAADDSFEYDSAASRTLGEVTPGINLQIGDSSTSADRLNVSINSFRSDSLFNGLKGMVNSTNDLTDAAATAAVKIKSNTDVSTYKGAVSIDITDKDAASAAADAIRQISSYVSDERGKLGAQQNRLDHTINNLTTASENTTAAKSRIVDTDMAKEMMEYTSKNVIAQAAQSMLAQANSQPQNVLSLLQ